MFYCINIVNVIEHFHERMRASPGPLHNSQRALDVGRHVLNVARVGRSLGV